jgi:outer membrane biosynthesis protein TonB
MGTGGWIVIAIIVIQAIAGGVSKIVEARKSGENKVLKPGSGARPLQLIAKPQTLQQKLEAVRQRRADVLQTPSAKPKPAPVAAPPRPKPKPKPRPKPQRAPSPTAAQKERSTSPPTHEVDAAVPSRHAVGGEGEARHVNDEVLASMLANPENFRAGLIFSELLAPPLALRPEREV